MLDQPGPKSFNLDPQIVLGVTLYGVSKTVTDAVNTKKERVTRS